MLLLGTKCFHWVNGCHWTMIVVRTAAKTISYYNSQQGSGGVYMKAILRWLQDESVDKRNKKLDGGWELIQAEAPQHHNEFDCGVFALFAADFLSDDLPLEDLVYSQTVVEDFRLKIGAAIVRGEILY
jgi:Ulp1 family protease